MSPYSIQREWGVGRSTLSKGGRGCCPKVGGWKGGGGYVQGGGTFLGHFG